MQLKLIKEIDGGFTYKTLYVIRTEKHENRLAVFLTQMSWQNHLAEF